MTSSIVDEPTTATSARRPRASVPRWIWLPLLVSSGVRLVGALLFHLLSRFQISTTQLGGDPQTGYFVFRSEAADPGYLGAASNRDGQWYQLIATEGYQPASVDAGEVAVRAWAFPPLYPKTVGLVMRGTGWDFGLASVVVSLVCSAVAMVLLFRLAAPHVGDLGAAGVVALTSTFVSAPLLQVAYSEPMGLALLCCALLLIRRESYWWAIIPTVLLSLTRIVTPPLALVAIACWVVSRRRGGDRRVIASGLVPLVVVCLSGLLYWSVVSTWLRGTAEGDRAVTMAADFAFGYFGAFWSVSPLGVLLPLTIAVLVVRIAWSERDSWGPELSSWAAGYVVFVLTVTPPTTGLVRYLLFAFPFALAVVGRAGTPARRRTIVIGVACALFLVGQVLWMRFFFLVAPTPGVPTLMP